MAISTEEINIRTAASTRTEAPMMDATKLNNLADTIYEALGGRLSREHAATLAASNISPEVAKDRGYATPRLKRQTCFPALSDGSETSVREGSEGGPGPLGLQGIPD